MSRFLVREARGCLDGPTHVETAGTVPHEVSNGLLLRADIHRLFEQGYITVTPDLRLHVSDRLRADYQNGRSYYPLNGAPIAVPRGERERPSPAVLEWHNENAFLRR